jgi:hypothetical protein
MIRLEIISPARMTYIVVRNRVYIYIYISVSYSTIIDILNHTNEEMNSF